MPQGWYDPQTRRYWVTNEDGSTVPAEGWQAARIASAGGRDTWPAGTTAPAGANYAPMPTGSWQEAHPQPPPAAYQPPTTGQWWENYQGSDPNARMLADHMRAQAGFPPQSQPSYTTLPQQGAQAYQAAGQAPMQQPAGSWWSAYQRADAPPPASDRYSLNQPRTLDQTQAQGAAPYTPPGDPRAPAEWLRTVLNPQGQTVYANGTAPVAPLTPQQTFPTNVPPQNAGPNTYYQAQAAAEASNAKNAGNAANQGYMQPIAGWGQGSVNYQEPATRYSDFLKADGSFGGSLANTAPAPGAVQAPSPPTPIPNPKMNPDGSMGMGGAPGPPTGVNGWNTSSVASAPWWNGYVQGGTDPARTVTDPLAKAYYTNQDPASAYWQAAESTGYGDQFNAFVARNFEKLQSRYKQLAEANPNLQLSDFLTGGLMKQVWNEFQMQAPQARGLDYRLTDPGRFNTQF